MKLSAKSDYATRAVLGLARRHSAGNSVRMDELATEQGIPPNYLVQILIELKSQGIVKSLRGKDGGYLLARPPAEVSMADVIRCVHGELFDSPALSDPHCPPELRAAWLKLQRVVDDTAGGITFQKLLDQGADKGKMYYI
jgi:Rrf2 family transcriptional regulator, cysteine metabolism repressor